MAKRIYALSPEIKRQSWKNPMACKWCSMSHVFSLKFMCMCLLLPIYLFAFNIKNNIFPLKVLSKIDASGNQLCVLCS